MWQYKQTNELYHYGVPGMKWGERKAQAKQAVKDARREYLNVDKRGEAYAKLQAAKAELAGARKEDPKAAERAEINTYARLMGRTGLKGSIADNLSGNKSTKLYDEIVLRKGKEYAERVEHKLQNVAVLSLMGTAAVAAGSAVSLFYQIKRKK